MRYSSHDIRYEPDIKFYLDSGYPARPGNELDAQPEASYLVDRILNLIIYAGYRIFLKTRYPDLMIIILLHPWRGITESILRSYRSGSGPREKPGPDPILKKTVFLLCFYWMMYPNQDVCNQTRDLNRIRPSTNRIRNSGRE